MLCTNSENLQKNLRYRQNEEVIMKEIYTAPELDITLFASDDVITTSVTPESDEMPIA